MASGMTRGLQQCVGRVTVSGAGSVIVNGLYTVKEAAVVPTAFALVCRKARWSPEGMWAELNQGAPWWEADNGSYIYLNRGDGKWWLDSGETGLGLYISSSWQGDEGEAPPLDGWQALGDGKLPLPTLTKD